MKQDKKLGIGLIIFSLLAAAAAGLFHLGTDGYVPIASFAWPALGVLIGMTLTFFKVIQSRLAIEDEIEQFPRLIADDLEQLGRRELHPTHWYVFTTVIAVLIESILLIRFHKIEASWGPINVMVAAAVVFSAATAYTVRSRLFQQRHSRMSSHFFVLPAIGWLICIGIGITFAEPREYGGVSALERSNNGQEQALVAAGRSRAANYALDVGSDITFDLDCDSEGCLILFLFVIVLVCILASAFIPHFWVVATILLLTLMGVFSLRELLYHENTANAAGQ
ncbi:MAG: hypothetical protein ACK2UK_04880 [Candidatus Promineifilaceae bacterium]